MNSLEKYMFFVPNRLYVHQGKSCLVSFNIAVIPEDMTLSEMRLHVPLTEGEHPVCIKVGIIGGGWDEQLAAGGYRPPIKKMILARLCPKEEKEMTVILNEYERQWRFNSLENHGVFLEMTEGDREFREESPPYLVVHVV